MRTYWSVVKNSARQLWRRRSFWVIHGLLFSLPILIAVLMFFSQSSLRFSNQFCAPGLFPLALYYLVLPILAGPVILEDFGKIGEILWSSPLDGLAHFFGIFSGLFLALFAGSFLQLGGWFLADLLWPNYLGSWSWGFSLGIYWLTVILGLSVTFLLAMIFQRILPLLISWMALWAWEYSTVVFSESFAEGFYPMRTIAYTNIFFHNLTLSPSLGLGLARDQIGGMLAWFLAISLAALCLALVLAPLSDRRRSTRLLWYVPLGIILSFLGITAGYALNANAIEAHALPPSPINVQIDHWKVLSQNTEVEVDAASGKLSGVMQLSLSPQQPLDTPEIVLRLNAGLDLMVARDESGQDLPYQRMGDSVVIQLPDFPTSPVSLTLAWEGHLQIPYTAYEQQWRHYDAPYPYGFTYMPQALRAFLQPTGGYLLRDGDWMPWPWVTGPHQGEENSLVIRPRGGEAVASTPMQEEMASWEGLLPQGLLAFLPGKQIQVGDLWLAASPLVGEQHLQQAHLFATSAAQLAYLFEAQPPRYVIVAPYLSEVIWNGDLLLAPDGSGYYLSKPVEWLYKEDITGPKRPFLARAALASLARAWLLDCLSAAPLEYQPVLFPAEETAQVVQINLVSEQEWSDANGHWVQAVESLDILTTWNPRRVVTLSPQGAWSAVAFWVAMELAADTVRQADLDLLAYFAGEGKSLTSYSQRYNLMSGLIWPSPLDTETGRQIVWDFHHWSLKVGPQEAMAMLAETIQETQPETFDQLIAALEQRSGYRMKEQP